MQTTLKQQIDAIQKAMTERRRFIHIFIKDADYTRDEQWIALNDAASTIMAFNIAPNPESVAIQAQKDKLI